MILGLVLSLISLPLMTSPVHAFTCPTSPASNTVEGCVVNRQTGSPVSGLYVFIVVCGSFKSSAYATTDSSGHFSFQNSICIKPNSAYPVSVNGATPMILCSYAPSPCTYLGIGAYALTWGQWVADVPTDGTGYGSVVIQLDPAQRTLVPVSALYSNTQYATLSFSKTAGQSVSQTEGIDVSIGGKLPVHAGFGSSSVTSQSFSSTNGFTTNPNFQFYYALPSYVIGYYCAGSTSYQNDPQVPWSCSPGLQTAGVTEKTGEAYQIIPTNEFQDPHSLSVASQSITCPFNVPTGASQNVGFSTAGSASVNFDVSAGLTLFGVGVTLTFSASTSWDITDATTMTLSPTNGSRSFQLFPASGSCDSPKFGSELHVWDVTGDIGVSASPNSLSIVQGSSGSSSITVTSLNGFSEGVSLSASAPSGIAVSFSPATLSLTSGGSGTSTAIISVSSSKAIGTYTVTIYGTSTGATVTRSTSISISVVSSTIIGGGGGGGRGCPCKL